MLNKKLSYNISNGTNYQISLISSTSIVDAEIVDDVHFGIIKIDAKEYCFNYYNDDRSNIILSINYFGDLGINFMMKNIEIQQLNIAQHLNHFASDLKNLPLVPYTDKYLPVIFYGMWSDRDLELLKNNKSLKIIIWTGLDIYLDMDSRSNCARVCRNIAKIKNLKNVKHIAISNFIAKDLEYFNIPYKRIAIMGIDLNLFNPVIKGAAIYVYTSPQHEKKYGSDIYHQLIDHYKTTEFIFTTNEKAYKASINKNSNKNYEIKYYTKQELIENIYPKCFIALRLTKHDGLAGTVQEMGCMGIKSVHNGDSPSCLQYKTFEDICQHIDREMTTIGTIDEQLSQKVKKYLTLNKDFLNTKFYN